MGGIVQGALGTASNLVGGLPIVGGMARQGIGQAGSMLGMPPQQGQQQGGLMGSKGGGQQGGLMGSKGGGQAGFPSMTNLLTGGWGGKGGFGQQIANFGNQSAGGMGAGNLFGGVPMSSMQRGTGAGQYGGGYAPNGRSLMPVGQGNGQPQLTDQFKNQYGM